MLELERLGWDADRDAEFAPFRTTGLVPGRVSLEHNHVFRILTADGEVLAESAGRMKHRAGGRNELPVVGDWVALKLGTAGTRSTVAAILTRRSWFSRKAAGRETQEQVIAANADDVLIVFGLDKPVNARAIERYLILVRRSGARPIVVLNKSDVAEDIADAVAQVSEVAGSAPIHAISTKNPDAGREHAGVDAVATVDAVDALESYLVEGKTLALLGPSGAGKSTIVNRLVGDERLPTGEVREWDRRGRHTSVHRELVLRAAGGLIIDTPGMRELQLWETGEDLDATFAEIAARAPDCRFRDCRHDAEPGCAVKAAVEAGEIDADRYENYIKLSREQVEVEKLRDERELRDSKRQGKVPNKVANTAPKSMPKDRKR
jgi:ribosome biogenesis GTPase